MTQFTAIVTGRAEGRLTSSSWSAVGDLDDSDDSDSGCGHDGTPTTMTEKSAKEQAARIEAERPVLLDEMLEAEHFHLHGGLPPMTLPRQGPDETDASDALSVYTALNACGHAAVCLSGGGIRSASFALGVLQGLAQQRLLGGFDYISTVSGGGYAGGWLAAWLAHEGPDNAHAVFEQLGGKPREGAGVEAEPVARMRAASRYMSSGMGPLSPDTWTLAATVLRNLLLNWTVILPLIAVALLLPHLYRALIQQRYRSVDEPSRQARSTFAARVALIVFGLGFVILNLPSYRNRRGDLNQFLAQSLIPLCLGAVGLTLFWPMVRELPMKWAVPAGSLGVAATWTIFALFGRSRRWRPRTTAAAACAGAGCMAALVALGYYGVDFVCTRGFAMTAVPLVLSVFVMTDFVFAGLAGPEIGSDDLEWKSRFVSWLLIVALGWVVFTGLVFYGPEALRPLRKLISSDLRSGSLDGVTGVIAVGTSSVLGVVASYLARSLSVARPGESSINKRITVALAAPVSVLLLLASVAWLNESLLRSLHPWVTRSVTGITACGGDNYLIEGSALGAALLIFGIVMGYFIPVNKFSLHGMYRDRLVRGFLGASRTAGDRHANPFTGFDPADDIEMHQLASVRPLLVVNMTLNTVADAARARLNRKAESFTASPHFVGSRTLGYRPTNEYASNLTLGQRGMSLGTAIAISGAAASPNMGTKSSGLSTFLLTLFNARLGAWLGNPGPSGTHAWRRSEPKQGAGSLLREMFGRTSASSPYVHLSDGGHYENLGLWQMLLRRCRYILVSDASCDPKYAFDDLAIAIRQARIDLGIAIVFDHGLGIDYAHGGNNDRHYAVGRILYSSVDGAGAEDGILIYVKATLSGDEPIDIMNYQTGHPSFPHEGTSDQWFDEGQFESYRALGFHSILQVTDGSHRTSPHANRRRRSNSELHDFFEAAATR